jgi:hypothetical protein
MKQAVHNLLHSMEPSEREGIHILINLTGKV